MTNYKPDRIFWLFRFNFIILDLKDVGKMLSSGQTLGVKAQRFRGHTSPHRNVKEKKKNFFVIGNIILVDGANKISQLKEIFFREHCFYKELHCGLGRIAKNVQFCTCVLQLFVISQNVEVIVLALVEFSFCECYIVGNSKYSLIQGNLLCYIIVLILNQSFRYQTQEFMQQQYSRFQLNQQVLVIVMLLLGFLQLKFGKYSHFVIQLSLIIAR
eukprot:TRINITY_DN72005_c0_g1_i3.p3 TRINITY_DN72005_c0_g1~~TRINITY_DN72005_c0_g1_i3.p3  ORF type:complete len:214 (-),score=11.30 TRINITY_DN72005_c0_g1_i3:48-689(-)